MEEGLKAIGLTSSDHYYFLGRGFKSQEIRDALATWRSSHEIHERISERRAFEQLIKHRRIVAGKNATPKPSQVPRKAGNRPGERVVPRRNARILPNNQPGAQASGNRPKKKSKSKTPKGSVETRTIQASPQRAIRRISEVIAPEMEGGTAFLTTKGVFVFVRSGGRFNVFELPPASNESLTNAQDRLRRDSREAIRATPSKCASFERVGGVLKVSGLVQSAGAGFVAEQCGEIVGRWEIAKRPSKGGDGPTRLHWQVLPDGIASRLKGSYGMHGRAKASSGDGRLAFIDSLKPKQWYEGSHLGSTIYFVAEFHDVVLADSVDDGNALYYVDKRRHDWKTVLRKSKPQAKDAGAVRMLHTETWEQRVRQLVRGKR